MTEIAQPLPRFDGASAWAMLSAEDQAAIGAIALECIVTLIGQDVNYDDPEGRGRPFIAAEPIIIDHLREAVTDALHASAPEALNDHRVPIPSLLGPVCRVCRCSEDDACENGCAWAEPDLCSACK